MQIFILISNGKTITVDVKDEMKIVDLKKSLLERTGIPVEQMKLLF